MSELIAVTVENIADNFNNKRIPLSMSQRKLLEKKYRYYGAQGIIDYVDSYLFDGDYILVAEDGENLKSQKNSICAYVVGKFWVNNHAHIIRAKNGFNTKYLYYKLNQVNFRNYVTGSAQPKLTKDNLNSIVLRIHNAKEQEKIASVLSSLDAKIELNNKINAELEAMAKTLYDYWFVQFDFPDKNGKPYKTSGGKMVWNEELKREIPEGWRVDRLSDIVSIGNESMNPLDEPLKSFKHYSLPAFDKSGTYNVELGGEIKSNKFSVKNTDILVSKLNPWFNRVIYSVDEENLICSTEFVVWRANNLMKKNYLYMIARDSSFITHCIQSAGGTSNSHKRVNPTVMMNYKIVFNEKIAESFGRVIDPTIKVYAKNHIENRTLIELRDWLLPMLMNGQVKVE